MSDSESKEPDIFAPPTGDRDVFINCPFDPEYKQFLNAIIFTIYDCGFNPRCALESYDAGALRLEKIYELIWSCPFGIHDLSRIEREPDSDLPRFNMALELGIFLGIKLIKGDKVCLVMDSQPYRYQRICSDLSGLDPAAHGNDVEQLIFVVRNWLRHQIKQRIPGGEYIFQRYKRFLVKLPELCAREHLSSKYIIYPDYVSLLEGWLEGEGVTEEKAF